MLKTIRQHHEDISRIQVSCRFMEEVILNTGIGPEKVFRIPIGINRTYFAPQHHKISRPYANSSAYRGRLS